jgi:hypothetical protein
MRLPARTAPATRAHTVSRLTLAFVLALPAAVVSSTTTAVPAQASHACPASRLAPRVGRPVVDVRFHVSPGKTTVYGKQHISFAPDLATSHVVLRQWANMPDYKAAGGWGRISKITISGAVSRTYYPADTRSTITSLTLPRTLRAGEHIRISMAFTTRLPSRGAERLGNDGTTAWWGSGHPMLAWEQGVGWATEPAGTLWGERTTSEAFLLRTLIVRARTSDVVLATGSKYKSVLVADGRRDHYFTAPSVRDVMVAVGPLRTTTRTVGSTRLVVAAPPNVADSVHAVADTFARSLNAHSARFGSPFPYPNLSVAVLPRLGGGIEFPGGIMMGSGEYRDATATHEVAHEYFYGLVGNNQGRDPWLDEAFATYAEALHRGTASTYLDAWIPSDGYRRVGQPMSYWETRQSSYYRSVYVQGARALLEARKADGNPVAFDNAIRCYVRAQAHRIARPSLLARQLEHLPKARAKLVFWGALPAQYAP